MPWYVLYTKSRNEKKTAVLLANKGIEVYCPVHEEIKQWSDRKKKVLEPLFKSYIFVKLNNYEHESVHVLTTPGAVRFLWWQGKPGVVRDEEIIAMYDFLNDYRGSTILVNIEMGQLVKITEGPLKEQDGKIISMRGNRAILHLRSLGGNIIATLPIPSLAHIEKK